MLLDQLQQKLDRAFADLRAIPPSRRTRAGRAAIAATTAPRGSTPIRFEGARE
jgi:hypothetical protein